MSTKNNPGAFRCYDAALPDEPFFTILGRDPAAPATLRFWAEERERHGKTETADDKDRIDDARRDATAMQTWRYDNLDPLGDGGPPSWKAVQMDDNELGPVRIEPDPVVYVYAERDGDEAVRVSIEWLQRMTQQLVDGEISRTMFAELMGHACKSPDRRRERVVPVEEAAYDAAYRDARSLTMMNAITNAIAMIDDLGAIPGYGLTVNAIRTTLFKGLDEACVGEFKNLMGYGLTPDDKPPVVDTQPHDLAHNPEVPPHRFSTFHKGVRYAYARGLEINPIHLPTALDAMAEDGWALLAIFGQTDSQHVGFIFERVTKYPMYAVDLSPPQPASEEFRRFMAGEPLDDIRESQPRTGPVVTHIDEPCGPDGRGRGLEP